jgi:hypothetical protein
VVSWLFFLEHTDVRRNGLAVIGLGAVAKRQAQYLTQSIN